MPDLTPEETAAAEEEAKNKPDPMAVMAESFKDMANEVKELASARAPAPAPVEAPVVDTAAKKLAAQKAFETARTEADELMSAGEHSAGMEKFLEGVLAVQAADQGDPASNPQVVAGIASAKKLSRAENKEWFDKYGDEIAADMAAVPVEQRINPESWDEAVKRVKANHIDEILEQRAKQNAEDLEKAEADAAVAHGSPPMAIRSGRAARSDVAVSAENLTEDELDAAKSCGLTAEKYAEAKVNYDKHTLRNGRVLFMNEPTTGLKIKPGAF